MKHECIDNNVGSMLHGYELNCLNESDKENFELHLMSCDYCLEELNKSHRLSHVILSDPDLKQRIKELDSHQLSRSSINKPSILRSVMYVCLAVLIIGIILFTKSPFFGNNEKSQMNTVELFPNRSQNNLFTFDKSDSVKIQFVFENSNPDNSYRIILYNEIDEVVYKNQDYSGFNDGEVGFFVLSTDKLKAGYYKLVITDPLGDPMTKSQEYRFSLQYK